MTGGNCIFAEENKIERGVIDVIDVIGLTVLKIIFQNLTKPACS